MTVARDITHDAGQFQVVELDVGRDQPTIVVMYRGDDVVARLAAGAVELAEIAADLRAAADVYDTLARQPERARGRLDLQ